jgi:hypothetical protein
MVAALVVLGHSRFRPASALRIEADPPGDQPASSAESFKADPPS